MKIESLHEFMVLAHYLNFTTAASNLRISQPNLSKHISEMEQELNVVLFKREKSLELTAAGKAFLEDVIQIHHRYIDAKKRCREIAAQSTEELVIQDPYVVDSFAEILFKSIMVFKRENPSVMTKYYSEKGKKSVELLDMGKVDIALTIDCNSMEWISKISEKKNLIFYPVIQEPLLVWLWKNHPLANKESISLEDLANTTINMTSTRSLDPMRFAVLDMFTSAIGRKPTLQALAADTLNEFFMNTYDKSAVFLVSPGIANSTLLKMQMDMISRPIDDERARITSYLLFHADYDKKSIDKLLETIERVVQTEVIHDESNLYLNDISMSDAAVNQN